MFFFGEITTPAATTATETTTTAAATTATTAAQTAAETVAPVAEAAGKAVTTATEAVTTAAEAVAPAAETATQTAAETATEAVQTAVETATSPSALDSMKSSCQTWLGDVLDFVKQPAFLWGLAIGAAVILLLWIIKCSCARSKNEVAIQLDDANGSFSITIQAFNAFLQFIMKDFSDLTLCKIKLVEQNDAFILHLMIKINLGCNLNETRTRLRERIQNDLKSKLGIGDKISAIDIHATEFVLKKQEEQAQ